MNEGSSAVMTELDTVVEETNALTIPDAVRAALERDLGPVAARIPEYQGLAHVLTVNDETEAKRAAGICDEIARDVKLVQSHDVLTKIITGLHGLHRKATGLRDAFVRPAEEARKQIRGKILSWQEAERIKAEAEQRRLQAEADERARKERERLEKEAARLKTAEKREERLEAAAAVVAPTVLVEAPKVAMRGVARVWKVKSVNLATFLTAASTDSNLTGYITVDQTRLQRAKSANPSLTVPGVVFEQVLR